MLLRLGIDGIIIWWNMIWMRGVAWLSIIAVHFGQINVSKECSKIRYFLCSKCFWTVLEQFIETVSNSLRSRKRLILLLFVYSWIFILIWLVMWICLIGSSFNINRYFWVWLLWVILHDNFTLLVLFWSIFFSWIFNWRILLNNLLAFWIWWRRFNKFSWFQGIWLFLNMRWWD